MKIFVYCILSVIIIGCNTSIKDKNASVNIEPGTDFLNEKYKAVEKSEYPELIGYWVGNFNKANEDDYENDIIIDEGFYWNRANKINLNIQSIVDGKVKGQSIVAGNKRPFTGQVIVSNNNNNNTIYNFIVREPGDNRYDGQFNFKIEKSALTGTWRAYKNLSIQERVYDLEKVSFVYNPNQPLLQSRQYLDWTKSISTTETWAIDEEREDETVEEWIRSEYASATTAIYEINASAELLSKNTVENLKRGDLIITRNAIYARHGYTFNHLPLRIFFDAQEWYIPVETNIVDELTEIEKANIKLLLKYEKNAKEYYDYFGRG